ncbi:hypothetical protein GCM10028856_35360 [Halopiger thermotolerans]
MPKGSEFIVCYEIRMQVGAILALLGTITGLAGLLIRVLPKFPRHIRVKIFSHLPWTKQPYKKRVETVHASRGRIIKVRNKHVCRSFVDYIDRKGLEEPPREVPKQISTGAAKIIAEYDDGEKEEFYRGGDPQKGFIEIIDLTLEQTCNFYGGLIAAFGSILLIINIIY